MADPKDLKKESKGDGGGDDLINKVIFVLLGLYILWAIIQRINLYFINRGVGSYGDILDTILAAFFTNVWPAIKIFAIVISVIATFGIAKILKHYKKLRIEENILYGVSRNSLITEIAPEPINPKWQQVQAHMNSKNPSEWRLAIIEADIMLDELLKSCGYHGETVGDRLKAVEKSDFTTLESAWEGHKVRNQIAHQGSSFEITEREAQRVVALFEMVFREFKII